MLKYGCIKSQPVNSDVPPGTEEEEVPGFSHFSVFY